MNKSIYGYVFLIAALLLSSCGMPAAPTEAPVAATDEPVMTEAPMTEEPATEEPTPTEVPPTVTEAPTEAPLEGEVFINIVNLKFNESSVTIRVGTTVTWTNNDDSEHTVTADDGLFDTSVVDGDTFSFTFTEAGEFPYHCEIHRGMQGEIIVVE
ncbi:MAG TPA: plastocyanin/azurin family copper-binding protein [Anaerolineales bacterium]|nr:plastocyanin/azurin family copper-binding protein [Anaerolineales bacterium]